MDKAAKQGFPAAQSVALLNMQMAGNKQEAYNLASILIQGELDPYMLRGLLEYGLLVGPVLGDPPVIPKRDQYADAWQLAICDLKSAICDFAFSPRVPHWSLVLGHWSFS